MHSPKVLMLYTSTFFLLASAEGNTASESAGRIRDALAGATGGTVCLGSPALQSWCAALGIEAAYWIDKGVSLAIDRHFETQDQDFANKHGITICYADGKCVRPAE